MKTKFLPILTAALAALTFTAHRLPAQDNKDDAPKEGQSDEEDSPRQFNPGEFKKRMQEEAVWSNPQMKDFASDDEGSGDLNVTLYDLVRTLQGILERAKSRPLYEVGKEDVTVPDMMRYLRSALQLELGAEGSVSAGSLFERQRSRRAMICLFLAILEMVRMQAVTLVQSEAFADIGIKRHQRFEEVFASEDALAAIQEEYS